ncbi:restriction endonuclease subunit S [Enterococcus sp. DIV0180]|uniref:restriction endonuclease subunit S n=1 Tax=Enterococcus sp. DIV0180 TaxID=2774749 RepID=UPI003D2FBC30
MSNDTQPEIRFPGFTEDWELRKLGEILVLLKDGTHGTHKDVDEGMYLLSAKNIKNGKINIDESDRIISEDEYKSIHKNFNLEKGDVLLTIVGSIGEAAVLENPFKLTFQRSVAYLRPNGTLTSQFLYTTIMSTKFQRELKKRQVVSAQPGIYLGDLSMIPIELPCMEEQQKIGTFFKQLDDTITLHQRKLDLLKETKKGFLQKMFPKNGAKVPEIRFPGFTGDWEERKFEEIWKRTSDKNKDLRFKPTDILSVAKMKYSDSPKNSTDEYMKTYFILKKGDIAFEGNKSKDYSFGRFVLNDVADGIVSHVFITFEPIAPMDINFMKIYINNEEVMKHKLVRSTTKTLMMTTLNVKDINRQMLPIPNLEEQQKIGTFFKQLDDTITLHQRKLDLLKETKKGFLQKMFV